MDTSTLLATPEHHQAQSHVSPDAVRKAMERLPAQSTKDVQEMRCRGEVHRLPDLIEACDAKLAKRPFEYDGDTAARMIEAEGVVEHYDLASATEGLVVAILAARPPLEQRLVRKIFVLASLDPPFLLTMQQILHQKMDGDQFQTNVKSVPAVGVKYAPLSANRMSVEIC